MIEQHAFVLHTRPYRENQLLVDLLTEQEGKMTASVYVGQSKRSIKKGLIQPFLPLKLALKGQGNIKQIAHVDSIAKSFPLVKHSLFSSFYINELLIRLLTDHIPCPSLFMQYQASLTALAKGADIAPQLRLFELSLLEELGLSFDFSPVFEHDASYFRYLPEQGFVPVYSTLPKQQEQCFEQGHLQVIAQRESLAQNTSYSDAIPNDIARTYKLLMRQVINQLLGNKPLNSRKLFAK